MEACQADMHTHPLGGGRGREEVLVSPKENLGREGESEGGRKGGGREGGRERERE